MPTLLSVRDGNQDPAAPELGHIPRMSPTLPTPPVQFYLKVILLFVASFPRVLYISIFDTAVLSCFFLQLE